MFIQIIKTNLGKPKASKYDILQAINNRQITIFKQENENLIVQNLKNNHIKIIKSIIDPFCSQTEISMPLIKNYWDKFNTEITFEEFKTEYKNVRVSVFFTETSSYDIITQLGFECFETKSEDTVLLDYYENLYNDITRMLVV